MHLLAAASSYAQSNTGSIVGHAQDATGKPVVAASVVIQNTDLSSKRTTTTDSHGDFRMSGLVPGALTVEAKGQGLSTRRPVRVTLGLGSTVQVTLQLSIPRVEQKTTVTAQRATSEGNTVAPPVNKQEASVSDFFAGMTVTYLPNRDRDFAQFGELGAGSTEDADGNGVDIAGQRSIATVTQVDGVSFNDPLEGGRRGANDSTFFLPQTVVREFQIVRSGVTAEVGGTDAGLLNIATKEGSNRLHGEAFYTVRPAWATSADSFGHSLNSGQNIFGWSDGGPIRKDRAFFYAGFEQDFLRAPYYLQFEPQASGIAIPTTLTALQGEIPQHSRPTALFGRVDTRINDANTLNVLIAGNRVSAENLGDGTTRSIATSAYADSLSGQSIWTKVGLTTLVSQRAVNQATVSWSVDHRNITPNSTAPEIFINGFGILGGNGLGLHLYTSHQSQFIDTMTITRGDASLDLGGVYAFSPAYEQQEENLNGRFDYNSLAAYLANTPRRYQQTFAAGNIRYQSPVSKLGLFANGKLSLGKAVTLTAGLRWDGQWNPQPPHPNAAIPQTRSITDDLAQWQPRLGIAWSANERTVVRVSSGLYSAETPATIFHRVAIDNGLQTVVADSYFDPQILATATSAGTAFASPPSGLTTPAALVVGIAPAFRNPRSFQAAATVEEEITAKLSFSAGVLHDSTWKLQRQVDLNLFPPVSDANGLPVFPLTRPNPAAGRVLVNESGAHSDYNGLLLSSSAQVTRRSQLLANYTLSRTRDDDSNSGPYSIDAALDPFDLQAERADSNQDIRHVFNLSAIFDLPLGLKCNPLFIAHSGRPYTPIIGFDTQHDANDWNDRALIDGTTAARNSVRQPAFSDLDLRLVKDFTLKGQGHHLDLFMDVFNLTGSTDRDFGADAVSLYGNAASPVASAGQALFAPDSTQIGGARAIQFTARLVGF
jgi:Carboxypeptidase regulatory-like domain